MDVEAMRGLDLRDIPVPAVVVVLTLSFLSWSWFAPKTKKLKKLQLPPGPRGLPVLGSLLSLGKVPHKSLAAMSKRYGPLMYMRLGSKPALVVCSSDMMREVLQTNDQVFASRPHLHLPAIIFGDNADIGFAQYGPQWRQARKICNLQLFTTSRLALFSGIIEREIMATIHFILHESESGKDVNLTNVFSSLSMNIITQMMWRKRHRNISNSSRSGTDKLQHIVREVSDLSGSNVADFLPFLRFWTMTLPGLERRAKMVRRDMDEFVEQIVCEREEQLSKREHRTDEDDFVDVLLQLASPSHEAPELLSRNVMKGILMDMLIGGTDTSANTLEWTFAELMRHPHVMSKAQDKLSTVIGNDRLVTQADIPNIKYLGALVKEILRIHGPAPLTIPHLCTSDCKVGGYDVPANTTVLLNMYAIHNDLSSWDEPQMFNPDRFLESSVDFRGRDFHFLPFSSGRRMCPGVNLASSVLHLGLAQLLHTRNWALPEGQTAESLDMTECPGLNLVRAEPLILIAKPRFSQDVIPSPGSAP